MKTNLRFLAVAAAILSMFTACQREELEQNQKPEALTHSVTFVAGAPETKTTATIDGNTVNYAWTAEDVNRFTVYENGTKAKKSVGILEKGKMTVTATFEGSTAPKNASYVAVVNSSNDGQIMSAAAYDEYADILVSKAVNSFDGENGVLLQFKREVAIAKMTLKGLDAGEVVNMVTVSSTSDIAGSYGVNGWVSPAKTSLEISSASYMGETDGYSIVANESGEAVVWFTCIPQDAATLTVKVQAADGDTYTKKFSKPITLTRGDVKGFGVAMVKDAAASPSETYNRITSQSELEDGEYVIGMALNSYPNTIKYLVNTTKVKPGCTDITGDISVSEDGKTINLNPTTITNAKWLIESVEGGFSISSMTEKPAGLATTKDNDGLTTQTTYLGKAWSITVDGETNACTMKYVPTSRYLNVYSLTNPRTYTSSTTNNNGNIYLYKRYDPRTTLATPANLAVTPATKLVSWDAVEGADSYVLTIGTEEYPCTSNSYDASAIEDEYYDVSVVAVPSDTENYKNSAAATLTNAKFGTPKLPTPTLSAGVIEETSVAFSWTKDARATNGYHWALYNGETLVQEATETSKSSIEVNGLSFGTKYTAIVYAIAVEGEKPYAQSETASLDLITKAKTTISTIVAAGTGTTKYAISDLTVMAVSGSNFVVKDETGLMFCYKTGATAGDVVTLEGTYEEYQGLNELKATVYTKTSTTTIDHGTATDLNSSNVAAYVENPVVQYVKVNVPVASDGSLKLGDVAVYQYGSSLASYAGRTINLYGYTLGYNTEKSNIVLLQTSVEIDQTVPYLEVDPTSKTWASDAKDAAIFTVTSNTEGDWSVSPTTIDWATIAIDKTAGTITVTPNDANAADTAREAKLTVSHSAGPLSETITLTQKAAGPVSKEPVVIILDAKSLNLTTTATTADSEVSAGNVTFVLSKGAKSQSSTKAHNPFSDNASILIGKSGAYIYNKTAIPGVITKFEIYANEGASTKVTVGVNFSNSPIESYSASAANTYTANLKNLDTVYDCSNNLPSDAKYFWYQVTNSNNSQVQFRITYIPE